jgi:hypothetical protein
MATAAAAMIGKTEVLPSRISGSIPAALPSVSTVR